MTEKHPNAPGADDPRSEAEAVKPRVPSTPEQQASAVERAFVNQRGHCDNLRALIEKRRRTIEEWQAQADWLPHLEDAAATMRRWADSKKQVKPQQS